MRYLMHAQPWALQSATRTLDVIEGPQSATPYLPLLRPSLRHDRQRGPVLGGCPSQRPCGGGPPRQRLPQDPGSGGCDHLPGQYQGGGGEGSWKAHRRGGQGRWQGRWLLQPPRPPLSRVAHLPLARPCGTPHSPICVRACGCLAWAGAWVRVWRGWGVGRGGGRVFWIDFPRLFSPIAPTPVTPHHASAVQCPPALPRPSQDVCHPVLPRVCLHCFSSLPRSVCWSRQVGPT
jgi:hypothetical protein